MVYTQICVLASVVFDSLGYNNAGLGNDHIVFDLVSYRQSITVLQQDIWRTMRLLQPTPMKVSSFVDGEVAFFFNECEFCFSRFKKKKTKKSPPHESILDSLEYS